MDFNLMRMGLSIFLSLNLAFDKIAPKVNSIPKSFELARRYSAKNLS
jgi:hypothetical protein